MSCYEWERGTLKLPSAEVAPLKALLTTWTNEFHDYVYTEARRFVRDNKLQGRSAVYDYQTWDTLRRQLERLPGHVYDAVVEVLQKQMAVYYPGRPKPEPRTWRLPIHDDLDQVAPRATKRTTTFQIGYEATISFKGREVTWDVPENNRACEHARAHPLAHVFFDHLRRMAWTRGSGGEIVGNNEYARESQEAGGGANYVVDTFPPPVPTRPSYSRSASYAGYRW